MDSRDKTASGANNSENIPDNNLAGEEANANPADADEKIGDELAEFAFLREEGDREVRLSFRDMPADSIAAAFRRANALFISLTGERTYVPRPVPASPLSSSDIEAEEDVPQPSRRRRRRRGEQDERAAQAGSNPDMAPGELIMRYFFATENIVYTVIIATSTGIIKSIAGIYPSAQLSEQEVRTRLSVIVH